MAVPSCSAQALFLIACKITKGAAPTPWTPAVDGQPTLPAVFQDGYVSLTTTVDGGFKSVGTGGTISVVLKVPKGSVVTASTQAVDSQPIVTDSL